MCSESSFSAAPEQGNTPRRTAYLAPDGFLDDLREELGPDVTVHGRLVLAAGAPRPAAWAENVWYDPIEIPIASIGDGAKALRDIQRNWTLYYASYHRRAKLIQE